MFASENVPTYYQSIRLTACVVKLTYVGAYEQTSGFMVGGINYSYQYGSETANNVEDAYYVQRAKTGDGLRVL